MHHPLTRRSLLQAGIVLGAAAASPSGITQASEPAHDVTFLEDFDELWRTLGERYCYFGEKRTDWRAVRRMYRPLAAAAQSSEAFAGIVGRVIGELYDAHTHLNDPAPDAPRGPYFDLWVEPNRDGTAFVTSVRDGSSAADAGITPGHSVVAIDGRPIGQIASDTMPRCLSRPDPAATAFALNVAVSGRRGMPRTLTVRSTQGSEHVVSVRVKQPVTLPNVESRMLGHDIGCIVVRSFADDAVVTAFDEALALLPECTRTHHRCSSEWWRRHRGRPPDHGAIYYQDDALCPHAQARRQPIECCLDRDRRAAGPLYLHR
jgi:carboxyl-terminal processing protease